MSYNELKRIEALARMSDDGGFTDLAVIEQKLDRTTALSLIAAITACVVIPAVLLLS